MAISNLQGMRVLITKPAAEARTLQAKIAANCGAGVLMPLYNIVEVGQTAVTSDSYREYTYFAFTSKHAVTAAMPLLQHDVEFFKTNIKWAAIGPGTAEALRSFGIDNIMLPQANSFNSAGLLQACQQDVHSSDRVLIFKGAGGVNSLYEGFKALGIHTDLCVVYKRVMPDMAVDEIADVVFNKKIDIMVFSCVTSLQNLCKLSSKVILERVLKIPILVVSQRISDAASQLGFKCIYLSTGASDVEIIGALAQVVLNVKN